MMRTLRHAILLVILVMGMHAVVCGQDIERPWKWRWNIEHELVNVPGKAMKPASGPSDTASIKKRVLEYLSGKGYLSAHVDSFSINYPNHLGTIYLSRGCKYDIGRVDLSYSSDPGTGETEKYEPVSLEGEPYSRKRLEREIDQIIAFYEERGYPLAAVNVVRLKLNSAGCTVRPVLEVRSGPKLFLNGLRVPNLKHTTTSYIKTAAGVRDSALVTPALMRRVRRNLQQTDLFSRVGEPEIIRREGRTYLQLNLEERNPNQIDVLAGYIPDATGGGTIIGDGTLDLRHLFWEGSRTHLSFQRLKPQVSSLEASFERNWIAGGPFGAGAGFEFYQQDTTYQLRSLHGSASYQLQPGTDIIGSLRRKIAAASDQAGNEVPVLDAATTFAGLKLESEHLDQTIMPTEGIKWTLAYETGLKVITDRRAEADSIENRLYQQQLEGSIQPYFTLGRRSVLTLSMHGYLMVSKQYTESELVRFGGARSLRGYREDQFMASRMLWGDMEYRYRLDPESYAFVFGATGTYYRPHLITESGNRRAQTAWLRSAGLGMAYTTRLGILKFSYAVSPEDALTNGKVHFGIETLF